MAPDSNEPKDPNGPQDGKKDQAGDKTAPPAQPPAPAAQDAAPPAPPAPPPPPKADPLKEPVASIAVDMLKQRFPNAIQEVTYHAGQTMVRLPVDRFVEIATFLRNEPDLRFDFLSNLLRRTPRSALKRHMLKEMGNAMLVFPLMTRARSDPDPRGDGLQMRHGVGDDRQAVVQSGLFNRHLVTR